MMSPPQLSSQVWGRLRAAQMSRKARIGWSPPIRVTFIPNPSTSPVPTAEMTVFRFTLFSSI